jgi:hypothetical protein
MNLISRLIPWFPIIFALVIPGGHASRAEGRDTPEGSAKRRDAAFALQDAARPPVRTGDYLGEPKPGREPRIFAPGLISTPRYEHSIPEFSPDGSEVYWGYLTAGHASPAKIEAAARIDGRWGEPRIVDFTGFDDMYPTFSPDGRRMYFSSGRDRDKKEEGKIRSIFFVERAGGGWSEPRPIGFGELDIYGLSVAANGNLFFMAARPDAKTQYDLYRSRFVGGAYEAPVRLESPISTEAYEDGPFIAPDESYLLFESSRPGGLGGMDFYVAFRAADGSWTEPVNLGRPVNSELDERFARFSKDGRYLFFGRNDERRSPNFDIYWVAAEAVDIRRLRGSR